VRTTLYRRLMGALARRAGVRAFRFFRRPLDPSAAVELPGIQLRQLAEQEALSLASDPELDLAADMVRRAFAAGDLCVGAFDGSRLAGYCWLAFAPVPHLDGVWVDFHGDAVWTYKSYVRPSDRSRGIAAALYRAADAACAERGRRFSILCVESHNGASIRAARKALYADAGRAAYVKARDSLLTWCSSSARRLGVRMFVPS
jgi:GNAT superfamily N-acetyltransferase